MTLLTCIAEAICGEEAAAASLQLFTLWLGSSPGVTAAAYETATDTRRSVQEAIAPVLTTSTRGSLERRTIRAVLCRCFTWNELHIAAEAVPGLNVCRRSYWKGRRDYEVLTSIGTLTKPKLRRKKFDESQVDTAIKTILAMENVAFVSWGTKRIKVDDVYHDVPSILRRRPISVMFEKYEKTNQLCVSKSTFYELASILTNGEVQARSAVDYVSGFLLNDNFELLKRIIRDILPSAFEDLSRKMNILKAWLKYGTVGHFEDIAGENDPPCARHLIKFGLARQTNTSTDALPITCSCCHAFHNFSAYIKHQLEESTADENTLGVVADCQAKLELFLGHRLRVLNQQRALHDLFYEMKSRCVGSKATEALVIIDFKMKAEPIYFREKTSEHYGKRGMSWHGAMVRFWTKELSSQDPFENKVYFDQISDGDNRQDKEAVVALLEALMISLNRSLPSIKTISVQSDNASCYQNALVLILLPVIGAVHGIRVERFIHTDTQDGKSMLDAHFARAMMKIRSFIQQGYNCITPSQLVAALNADGGVVECVAELIEYDRLKLQHLEESVKRLAQGLRSIRSRVNDVFYFFPMKTSVTVAATTSSEFDLRAVPSFTAQLFSYSGVGDGVRVVFDFENTCCTIESDQHAGAEDITANANDGDVEGGGEDINDVHDLDTDVQYQSDDSSESGDEDDSAEEDDQEDGERIDIAGEERIYEIPSATGVITGVSVTKSNQIRRRARKWKRADVPAPKTRTPTLNVPVERDIASYAKRSLIDMRNAGDLVIIEAGGLPREMADMNLCFPNNSENIPSLKQGWARRPAWGKMYGARYIKRYEKEVAEMFQQGVENSSRKLGPARMVEVLIQNHPQKYDIPSENEIRAEISKLARSRRKRPREVSEASSIVGGNEEGGGLPVIQRRKPMKSCYASFLEDVVTSDPGIKPQLALQKLRLAFPLSSSELDDFKITTKVSSIKQKLKKRRNFTTPTKKRTST